MSWSYEQDDSEDDDLSLDGEEGSESNEGPGDEVGNEVRDQHTSEDE